MRNHISAPAARCQTQNLSPLPHPPPVVVVSLESNSCKDNNNQCQIEKAVELLTSIEFAAEDRLLYARHYGYERIKEVVDAALQHADQTVAGWTRKALDKRWNVRPKVTEQRQQIKRHQTSEEAKAAQDRLRQRDADRHRYEAERKKWLEIKKSCAGD